MNVQRSLADPFAVFCANQEERVRRRLAVPSTRSAVYERLTHQKLAYHAHHDITVRGYHVKPPLKAVLTQDEVRAIRSVFDANPTKRGVTAQLARHYGVDRRTIDDIRLRRTWSYVA